MNTNTRRVQALAEKMQAPDALPVVNVVTRSGPTDDATDDGNDEAMKQLAEVAAGRARLGYHIRIVRVGGPAPDPC